MLKIETANAANEAAVKKLLADCDLPAEDLAPEQMQHFRVLRDGDVLVGSVGLEVYGATALLRSLAVTASHRGQGLGIRLVEQAEAEARALGVHEVYLLTTTAERFFDARGYERFPRDRAPAAIQGTTEFRTLCPATAVCMVKRLA